MCIQHAEMSKNPYFFRIPLPNINTCRDTTMLIREHRTCWSTYETLAYFNCLRLISYYIRRPTQHAQHVLYTGLKIPKCNFPRIYTYPWNLHSYTIFVHLYLNWACCPIASMPFLFRHPCLPQFQHVCFKYRPATIATLRSKFLLIHPLRSFSPSFWMNT